MHSIRNFLEETRDVSRTKKTDLQKQFQRYRMNVRIFIKHVDRQMNDILQRHQQEKNELLNKIDCLKQEIYNHKFALSPVKPLFMNPSVELRSERSASRSAKKKSRIPILKNIEMLSSLNKSEDRTEGLNTSFELWKNSRVVHQTVTPQFSPRINSNEKNLNKGIRQQENEYNRSRTVADNLSMICDELNSSFMDKDLRRNQKFSTCIEPKGGNQYSQNEMSKSLNKSTEKENGYEMRHMLKDLRNNMNGNRKSRTNYFRSSSKVKIDPIAKNIDENKEKQSKKYKTRSSSKSILKQAKNNESRQEQRIGLKYTFIQTLFK